jgi:hypothetical protein
VTLGCGGKNAVIKGHFCFTNVIAVYAAFYFICATEKRIIVTKKEQKKTINLQNAVYKISVL